MQQGQNVSMAIWWLYEAVYQPDIPAYANAGLAAAAAAAAAARDSC